MFEFINILWSLIFIKSIRWILEVQQNQSWRTRREIGKSSTCEYNLRVNYSHLQPVKPLFTSWLFVVVSRADAKFEEVKNWLQTTVKKRKTWWNQKSLGCLFTSWMWACFKVLTSLSSTKLIFDLCNRFEFINLLHVFLKFNKTDKVEQLGERSASQAHANIIYRVKLFTFCSLYKLLFTSWLFVVVSRADKHFEGVQNWPQTTLKRRKTWWNQKSAWLFVYHSNYNYLTWACFEVLSSSSSTTLIFNYREYYFQSRIYGHYDKHSWKIPPASSLHHFFEASLSMRRPQGLKGTIAQFVHFLAEET